METQKIELRKDIPDVWQWGITNKDLIEKMESLGYKLIFHNNFGQYGNLKNFENHAFIFSKHS